VAGDTSHFFYFVFSGNALEIAAHVFFTEYKEVL